MPTQGRRWATFRVRTSHMVSRLFLRWGAGSSVTVGGDGAVVVFDLTTYAVLGKILAQADADGIIFDPGSGLVLAVSGDKEC
jgi:hypothetical protein